MATPSFFEIGGKRVSVQQVITLLPPSDRELGELSGLLGALIGCGVPLGKSLESAAACVQHPWLIMGLAEAQAQIRRSDGPYAAALRAALEQFCQENAHAPNLLGYFNTWLAVVEAGEEGGELDTALFKFSRIVEQAEASGKLLPGDRGLRRMLVYLSGLLDMGVALLDALRLLKADPRHYQLEQELATLCERVQAGERLSQAFQALGGPLSLPPNPLVVSMLDAGEKTGCLELALQRLID